MNALVELSLTDLISPSMSRFTVLGCVRCMGLVDVIYFMFDLGI